MSVDRERVWLKGGRAGEKGRESERIFPSVYVDLDPPIAWGKLVAARYYEIRSSSKGYPAAGVCVEMHACRLTAPWSILPCGLNRCVRMKGTV